MFIPACNYVKMKATEEKRTVKHARGKHVLSVGLEYECKGKRRKSVKPEQAILSTQISEAEEEWKGQQKVLSKIFCVCDRDSKLQFLEYQAAVLTTQPRPLYVDRL
jgi:hypothetical protein